MDKKRLDEELENVTVMDFEKRPEDPDIIDVVKSVFARLEKIAHERGLEPEREVWTVRRRGDE